MLLFSCYNSGCCGACSEFLGTKQLELLQEMGNVMRHGQLSERKWSVLLIDAVPGACRSCRCCCGRHSPCRLDRLQFAVTTSDVASTDSSKMAAVKIGFGLICNKDKAFRNSDLPRSWQQCQQTAVQQQPRLGQKQKCSTAVTNCMVVLLCEN